jgi:hypothetical protein
MVVFYHRPSKYIVEAPQTITNFLKYKAFNNAAVRDFYSLLRCTFMEAKNFEWLLTDSPLKIRF